MRCAIIHGFIEALAKRYAALSFAGREVNLEVSRSHRMPENVGMAASFGMLILFIAMACAGPALDGQAADRDIPVRITLTPGQIAAIRCKLPAGTAASGFRCRDRKAAFFIGSDGYLSAFVSEPYSSKFTPYACTLQTSKGELVIAEVTVGEKTFPREQLRVDPAKVTLSSKDASRVERERKIIAAVYKEGSSDTPYFNAPFIRPLSTKVTSVYGIRRVFNKKQKGQHLGIDFAAGTGTPVKSSNRGKVVFTGNLFYAGNSVIVDHGMGIYTIYAHLSEISTAKSSFVDRGEVVGLSGETGRVTGPHLHWGVRAMGELCDGLSIVDATADFPGFRP